MLSSETDNDNAPELVPGAVIRTETSPELNEHSTPPPYNSQTTVILPDDIFIAAISNDPAFGNGFLWGMLGDEGGDRNIFGSQSADASLAAGAFFSAAGFAAAGFFAGVLSSAIS